MALRVRGGKQTKSPMTHNDPTVFCIPSAFLGSRPGG